MYVRKTKLVNIALIKIDLEKFRMSILTCSFVSTVVGTNFGVNDNVDISSVCRGFDARLNTCTCVTCWFTICVCRVVLV